MPSLVALLRRLADEYEAEEKGEQTAAEKEAAEKRIAELEARVNAAPSTAMDGAEEELSEEEWALIQEHRAGGTSSGNGGEAPPSGEQAADPPSPKKTRPGRKAGNAYMWDVDESGNVRKLDIAHVYNGQDEPDTVELPAETPAVEGAA